MTREEQREKAIIAIRMYKDNAPLEQIQEATGYTQSRVFQILKAAGVPTHRKQYYNDEPDMERLVGTLIRRKTEAIRALVRADMLDTRPQFQLTDEEFSRLHIKPTRRKQVEKFLKGLGLMLWTTPYPALFSLRENKYYRITHRELMFLHADPARWLHEAAPRIKRGWKINTAKL